MEVRVKFNSDIQKFIRDQEVYLNTTALRMSTDIQRQATIFAPVETGNLRNSGQITKEANASYIVSFGNSRVRYARRRHYENDKNPGTRLYLKRAGDDVSRRVEKYIKKI